MKTVNTQTSDIVRDIAIDNLVPNRDSITLVWFYPTQSKAHISNSLLNQLRALNDYILFYTDRSLYLDYLSCKQKQDDHIIAVLYCTDDILTETHNCEQVRAILLMTNDETKKENYEKIVGIFNDESCLFNQLQHVIVNIEHDIFRNVENIFTKFNQKERTLRDLRNDLTSFIWCHLFKGKMNFMKILKFYFEIRIYIGYNSFN